VSKEEFADRICGRRARIKALLLDRAFSAALAISMRMRACGKAKIHPARLGANLSRKQAHTLRRVLQNILRKAIVLRGSSISDFLDAEGSPENISATIARMDARAKDVIGVRRRSGARL